jgi:hypothetical protein
MISDLWRSSLNRLLENIQLAGKWRYQTGGFEVDPAAFGEASHIGLPGTIKLIPMPKPLRLWLTFIFRELAPSCR